MSDLAFLILEAILVSLFSSRELREPRYLNWFMKWMYFSLGRSMLQGMSFSFCCLMASLMEVGKYVDSDLDLLFWSPTCIVRPIFLKWSRMVFAAFSRSSLFSYKKTLSST